MQRVAAVMPCRGRVEWARQSLACFFAQTYEAKSIVILDDEDDPAFPGGVTHPLVQYSRLTIRYNIPTKLNMACRQTDADVIAKWDSDDWYAPTRIAEQIWRMAETGKAVTGHNTIKFFKPATLAAWEYRSKVPYACGTTLMFLRSFWSANPFNEKKNTGSDNEFVRAARSVEHLDFVPCGGLVVARIHEGNSSEKERLGPEYVSIALDELPAEFLASELTHAS